MSRTGVEPVTEMPPELAILIAKFKRRRLDTGRTQTDVDRATSLGHAYYSRMENGQVINPTIHTLLAIAAALNMELSFDFKPRLKCSSAASH